MKSLSPDIITPLLSLLTSYSLAAMAIVRGRLKSENLLLALVCVSWSLTSWAFLAHNIFSDEAMLLKIERGVHTLYVFMPAVSVLFFQAVTGQKNRLMLLLFFLAGAVLSISVHTGYYFTGFYIYEWGRIARGGPAFRIFAMYGIAGTLYIIFMFYKKMRVEKNSVIRTKIYYLFIAYFLSVVLIFTCIPAMHGHNISHFANYVFIPIAILTYGILRYRLMDISSIIYTACFWMILSSIIVIPNIILFIGLKEYFYSLDLSRLVLIFIAWFMVKYFYFIRIQPMINHVFDRVSYNFKNVEDGFNRELSRLMSLEDLAYELTSVLKRALNLENTRLFFRRGYMNTYSDLAGWIIDITPEMQKTMLGHVFFEKSLIESSPVTDDGELGLIPLFDITESEYIVPMNHRDEIISVLFLSRKRDGKRLNDREFRFITRIKSYASIAVANSVIYQDLSDMKDNLEKIVEDRTSIIERQKTEMERDIELARKIQIALLPNHIPHIRQMEIAYRYEPVMKVGGDFIDIHYREGMSQLGLFICDVSGHGAASAMIASMVKMSLNSWGKFINSPGKAFMEMRSMLYGKMGDNFVTACMCGIDLETGRVISANAGHPPLIIARNSGAIDVVKSDGKIIIDFTASEYEEKESYLEKGDRLVLYTDGVVEARYTDWEYGEERFLNLLKNNMHLHVDEICRRVYEGVALDRGVSSINDDFAILIAEYKGN